MNAIILAAGLGSRFKEWTKNNHKSLFPIQGTPNIERTINYLIEAEVTNIYIVTGHMSHKFCYLEEKYEQVILIYNPKYSIYNSIYTFSLVLSYFSDSWVIDADTVLMENIFKDRPKQSTYYTIIRNSKSTEWCPVIVENKITDILITDESLPSLSGISYWIKNDCEIIARLYKQYMREDCLLNAKLYWDNIVKENITKLNITIVEVPENMIFEMDEQKEYLEILNYLETR